MAKKSDLPIIAAPSAYDMSNDLKAVAQSVNGMMAAVCSPTGVAFEKELAENELTKSVLKFVSATTSIQSEVGDIKDAYTKIAISDETLLMLSPMARVACLFGVILVIEQLAKNKGIDV